MEKNVFIFTHDGGRLDGKLSVIYPAYFDGMRPLSPPGEFKDTANGWVVTYTDGTVLQEALGELVVDGGDIVLSDGTSIFAESQLDMETRVSLSVVWNAFRHKLTNPDLVGEALAKWQEDCHYADYSGPVLATCSKCLETDLPSDRYFRSAWEWSD